MAIANSTTTPWFHKASKSWCITRKGKRYYLGKTEIEARQRLNRYQNLIDRGLRIPPIGEDLPEGQEIAPTVRYACNVFLTAQKRRVACKDLTQRSYNDYLHTCKSFIEHVNGEMWVDDLKPEHFSTYRAAFAERRNLIGVGNEVTRVKTIFNWFYENGHIDKPVRFGTDFRRPKKRDVRLHKHRKGQTVIPRNELLLLLDELGIHYRAMTFLAINCGFKNADCSDLRLDELFHCGFENDSPLLEQLIDIDTGEAFIASIRGKTGEYRFATLWPETLTALKLSLSRRPNPNPEYADRVFLHYDGNSLDHGVNYNLIGDRVRGAMQRLKIHEKGKGFAWIRHTFRTTAEKVNDDVAVRWVMGHTDDRIDKTYIHNAPVERIRNVANHVRSWLFGGDA